MELVFPEFLTIIKSDINTVSIFLKDYFLPRHYLALDIEEVAAQMERVSQKQHGKTTLSKLIELAEHSIGIPVSEEFEQAVHATIGSWLTMIETTQVEKTVMNQMIALAKQTPYFEILNSLKGVSDKMAAFFIPETHDLASFDHYRQLETYASLNLRQTQSRESRSYS